MKRPVIVSDGVVVTWDQYIESIALRASEDRSYSQQRKEEDTESQARFFSLSEL